jgi:hypothetical protein
MPFYKGCRGFWQEKMQKQWKERPIRVADGINGGYTILIANAMEDE